MVHVGPDAHAAPIHVWQQLALCGTLVFSHRLNQRDDRLPDVVGKVSPCRDDGGLGRLDDPARFRPWAYRIVSNKCADWTRRRVVQRSITQNLQREVASTQANGPDETDSANELARLRDALAKLPEQQRAALSLYYLEGMSVSDVARVLCVARGTVKSQLYNARGRLKKALERTET